MTYTVSSGTLNLTQSINSLFICVLLNYYSALPAVLCDPVIDRPLFLIEFDKRCFSYAAPSVWNV